MVEFENISFLHWLWGIPLIILYALYTRSRQKNKASAGYPNFSLTRIKSRRYLGYLTLLLLMACTTMLIIALANPIGLAKKETPINNDADIVFVADVSKSMLADDVFPDRLTLMKNFIRLTITGMKTEQVGMVVFAGAAHAYLPLNTDYVYSLGAVKLLSGQMLTDQGTAISRALKVSSLLFDATNRRAHVICLLSDGETHDIGYKKMADSLRTTGIKIVSIGVGTLKGCQLSDESASGIKTAKKDAMGNLIISRLNENVLTQIAGAKELYSKLENADKSAMYFKNYVTHLPPNKQQKQISETYYFQLVLLTAFFLLLIEMLLP